MSKQELHPRTAVLNKNQKNRSKKLRTDALTWLATNFPAAFDNSICIRPLKIGIMSDILVHADKAAADGVSKSKLREAVVLFTRRLDYLTCIKSREMRIDLKGNHLEAVTDDEAEHAALKIKKRVEKSARNARKLFTAKINVPSNNHNVIHSTYFNSNAPKSSESEEHFPVYPVRSNNYQYTNTTTHPVKTAAVIVKHRNSKTYDPNTVARLKEKLGLSAHINEKKEAVE